MNRHASREPAHESRGIGRCDVELRSRECVGPDLELPLECVWLDEKPRTTHFDLATLSPYRSSTYRMKLDPEIAAMAQERHVIAEEPSGSPVERVRQILETGKATLPVDGFIVTTVWLMSGGEVVNIQMPVWEDQAGKLLAMHDLATRVQMLNADGFCLLGEVWTAPAPTAEQIRAGARNHPDRTEGIHAFALRKDGGFLSIVALHKGGRQRSSVAVLTPRVRRASSHWCSPFMKGCVLQCLGEEDYAEDPRPWRDVSTGRCARGAAAPGQQCGAHGWAALRLLGVVAGSGDLGRRGEVSPAGREGGVGQELSAPRGDRRRQMRSGWLTVDGS